MQDKVMLSMESRMRGDMQVRFGGRYEETYCRKAARRLVPSLRLGKGGDIFTLAGEFLQSDDFMKQAKFIAEAANMTVAGWEKPVYLSKPTESVFEDVEVAPLLRSLLTEYLEERGIPYAIASRHYKNKSEPHRKQSYPKNASLCCLMNHLQLSLKMPFLSLQLSL